MTLTNRKYLYIAAGILVVAAVLYFSVFRDSAVIVETASVARGPVTASINAEGKTRYHDRYTITAPVSGKMFRIQLHEGDRVPKGFVLTRIDPAPPRPLNPAETPQGGTFPYAYNVFVPEDGLLTKILVASEGIVQAGTPIAEVSKPSYLEVIADVLSADATQIRPHMLVRIENWGGDGALTARVRTVEPQAFTKVSALGVEEQRVNVIVDFDKIPENLGDNYRVDVGIVLWEGKDVLRVPSSALFRTADTWSVYVVERGKAVPRTVEVRHRSPSFAEVTSGLTEGEIVILHPPSSITDGTRVSSR